MKQIKRITLLLALAVISCENTPKEVQKVGFAGNPNNGWILGKQESLDTWLTFVEHHVDEDLEGIMKLTSDSIFVELPNGESIAGKDNFKAFLSEWFDSSELSVNQRWGIPIKFVNAEGESDDGDWVINGHSITSTSEEITRTEENQLNAYIINDKVQFFRVHNYKTTEGKLVDVTFSVDMSSYEDSFSSVSVFGSFNDWCGTCDPMTDADGDGVYTTTASVPVGEVEYKFSIDNQSVEESFVPGSACTKTTGEYTNRITAVEASSTLEAVCFNSCTTCE